MSSRTRRSLIHSTIADNTISPTTSPRPALPSSHTDLPRFCVTLAIGLRPGGNAHDRHRPSVSSGTIEDETRAPAPDRTRPAVSEPVLCPSLSGMLCGQGERVEKVDEDSEVEEVSEVGMNGHNTHWVLSVLYWYR